MSPARRRHGARAGLAAAVLLAWFAGIGLLVRREYFRPSAQRLLEAALRVTPGASFYAVRQGGSQIGFASTTIDTTAAGITVADYVVADIPLGGRLQRASAQTSVNLSRGFGLRDFTASVQGETGPIRVAGRAFGDTLLVLAISAPGAPPDTQRVRLTGPVLLPTLVPLQIALSEPEVGKRYTFATFDPTAMAQRELAVTIAAESVFVVADSARYDAPTRQWVVAHEDTVRAWRIQPEGAAGGAGGSGIPGIGVVAGWVDEQGRLVQSAQAGGIALQRTAYEVAFENWRIEARRAAGGPVDADRDVLESTAIAADQLRGRKEIGRLRVRLSNVDLAGFDLEGGRQALRGDTLVVTREDPATLRASYIPAGRPIRQRFRAETSAEPLIQATDSRIVLLAVRIAGQDDKDPVSIARKITRWVHDSLRKDVSIGVPSALQVLEARRGDCNEHAVLAVALLRGLGIPARVAAGLAYVNGKFYYHAWPEVWLARWVATDPTFGEFPADAAHLRFVSGGLTRQAELLRLIGALRVDVLEAR